MAKRTETTGEDDSLLLTRNLLRIAIYNISYIRGMKLKKLMPMDAESRRLIDWMKKGVYDARQKKYLKTLLFCICEKEEGPMIKEYAFSFANPMSSDKSAMNLSRTGSQKNSATFKSNLAEVTTNETRFSGSKMIRTLDSLMRTLNQIPEERTILMKLLYYDGVTVKSVLDPCDDNNVKSKDYNISLDNEPDQDNDFSDTEVRPSEAECYIVAPNDDTQDPAHEEELTAQVREWICSRDTESLEVSDILIDFPDISMEMVEDIMERLLKDALLSTTSKDSYSGNKIPDPTTPHIKKEVIMQNVSPTEGTINSNDDLMDMKVLYYSLPMDYVSVGKLHGKLDGEANKNMVFKPTEQMVQDGYGKNSANRRLAQVREWTWSSHNKNTQVPCQSALAVIKKDTSFYKTSWFLDSGSSYHITGNQVMLLTQTALEM